MARPTRPAAGGICYHVLNRGNGRMRVFHKPADYRAFEQLLADACKRLPMRILGWCLMPNHFHLVLWPHAAGDLSRWMQWLTTAHVRRYHQHYGGSGHVWQGRFKCFPIQQDEHLLIVRRYVERNPLRAKLVRKAERWAPSSLRWWGRPDRPAFLHDGPTPLPEDWLEMVNQVQPEGEVEAIRASVKRDSPFGRQTWREEMARRLGIESTLRPRGRPKKMKK